MTGRGGAEEQMPFDELARSPWRDTAPNEMIEVTSRSSLQCSWLHSGLEVERGECEPVLVLRIGVGDFGFGLLKLCLA